MGKYLSFLLLFVATSSTANIYWQPVQKNVAGGHSHGRQAKQFMLMGEQSDLKTDIEYIHSDLDASILLKEQGVVTLKSTGKDSYHALVARQRDENFQSLAVRYIYSNGRPVKTSPSDLLALELGGLQVIPAPLPREHWKYESRKAYTFHVVFNGVPLVDHPLLATTIFGSNRIIHTDEDGVVELVIPEDFPEIIPRKRGTPAAELQLFSSLEDKGILYETSFTAAYHASSENWKSVSLGAGVALVGLLAGFVVNRRLPEHNRRKIK